MDDIFYKFSFKLEEGEQNAGLMNVVFDEYINNPFLENIRRGHSFIAVGESPLLDRQMNFSVERTEDKIEYKLTSQLFKNKIVPESQVGKESNTLYMELVSGSAISLKNASAKNLGQIMFLLVVVEILNGMLVEVDIEDYIPRCANCTFEEENIKLYSGSFHSTLKTFLEGKTGCVINYNKYGDDMEIDCPFFVRNTNPDLRDVEATLTGMQEVAGVESNGNDAED
jgi:hypothetical protein